MYKAKAVQKLSEISGAHEYNTASCNASFANHVTPLQIVIGKRPKTIVNNATLHDMSQSN